MKINFKESFQKVKAFSKRFGCITLIAATSLMLMPQGAMTFAAEAENAEDSAAILEYSWEDLLDMNKGKETVAMFDENGQYLIFYGDKYCDDIITNDEEALNSLGHISTLLGLDDVNLSFYRKDTSPITGNVYYTFNQTSQGEINGQVIDARFYNSLVKVITDSEGHSLGVSADLNHDPDLKYSYDSFVTMEEANGAVQNSLGDGRKVYTELTELVYWNDEGTARQLSNGKVIPAYLVYTDADPSSQYNTLHKPYEVYVIAAEYSNAEAKKLRSLVTYYTDTIDPEANIDVYTSEFYFKDLEDAGEYTYTVRLDWVKEAYPDYEGEMSREVTVPVMKDNETGLYYLGSKSKRIACTNAYDFKYYDTLNSYVTENPEDINSWHFYKEGSEEDGIEKYFNDPDYVLSAFEVFVDVVGEFSTRYGLTSVDETGLPLLLEVYCTDSYIYPDSATGFMRNAYNAGQVNDWETMAVSPAYPECLSHSTMGHEYTHGINSQLTKTQYFNGPGAIMESYADIIGTQISLINGYHDDAGLWEHGGTYYKQARSLAEPNNFYQPKYYGGVYYMDSIDGLLGRDMDYGGVHQNSGIFNYLAYCLVNGSPDLENTNVLSIENDLDMWFETLYMTTYTSNYTEVAQYLRFAAKCMNLPQEQQDYLYELMKKTGVAYDENYDYSNDVEEASKTITFTLRSIDHEYDDRYEIGISLYTPEARYMLDAGVVAAGNDINFKVKTEDECIPEIYIGNRENGLLYTSFFLTNDVRDHYDIVIEDVPCKVGETYFLIGDRSTVYHANFSPIGDYLSMNEEGRIVFSCLQEGVFCVSAYNEANDSYRVVCFQCTADDAETE